MIVLWRLLKGIIIMAICATVFTIAIYFFHKEYEMNRIKQEPHGPHKKVDLSEGPVY